jgi:hypothetical protein
MPHDRNGKLIKAGDIVNIPCRVMAVYAGDTCNVQLEAVVPGHQSPEYKAYPSSTMNADQVELVELSESIPGTIEDDTPQDVPADPVE